MIIFLLFLQTIQNCLSQNDTTDDDPSLLSKRSTLITDPLTLNKVEDLANLMSRQLLSEYENRTRFRTISEILMTIPYNVTGGYETLQVVTEHVEHTLKLAKKMLLRLRYKAQEAFGTFYRDDITGFDYVDRFSNTSGTGNITIEYTEDERFNNPINFSNSSVSLPLDVYYNWTEIRRTIQWTEKLDESFKRNLVNASTGYYQHFSTPEGVMRSYPAIYQVREEKWVFYDPRQKTWYSTGSMEPKSIVFLIDGSGSIFGEAMRLLKETVKNVLLSLVSDLDYIDVAIFGNKEPQSLVNCGNGTESKLRRTTQATKSYLTHAIENAVWSGVSNVTKGFDYAFNLLDKQDYNTCHRLIVLFTDYTNENLIPYISRRDEEGGGDTHVVIFTYGFEGWIRRNLSEVAAHFEGYSVKIKNLPQIFTAARGITNVFTRKGVKENKIQFPFSNSYNDGWGQGYIVTLLLPVLSDTPPPSLFPNTAESSFLGVAGIDLPTRMFGEFSMANQQGCFTQAVNARGYVVYHPLFNHITMEEIDVKYHQFIYLVNSTDEMDIEKHLVYQNYSGTMEIHSSIIDSHFRSKYVTKYEVFMNPIDKSDFALALFCPNRQQLTRRMTEYEHLAQLKVADILDGVVLEGFHKNFHCEYERFIKSADQREDMTLFQFYQEISVHHHPDCADTLLQSLYEAYHFKQINLEYGTFIITANGNRYKYDGNNLMRYADATTMVLYNYITAISTVNNPLVVLENEGNKFVVAKVIYHSTGMPMAVLGYNITSYTFNKNAKKVFELSDIKRNNMYVLDQSGYVTYSNRKAAFGKFIGHIEPCALHVLYEHRIYDYYEEGQCYHTCEREPGGGAPQAATSAARAISHLIKTFIQVVGGIWHITKLLVISLLQTLVSGHEKRQCCKYVLFYQRNDSYPPRPEIYDYDNGCLQFSVAPIPQTNLLLLVTPRAPTCACRRAPVTLEAPKPTFAGPCTVDDRNYNNRRYVCSEEIETDHESGVARLTASSALVFSLASSLFLIYL